MPPADNSRFVLTNVMVRTLIVTVAGFALSTVGFYVKNGGDLKAAVLDAILAAVAAGGITRAGEGLSMDFLRSTKKVPDVSPGDVGATSPPIRLPE